MTISPKVKDILTGNLDFSFIRLYIGINWVILSLLIIGSIFLFKLNFTLGILLGGLLVNLNCVGLNRDCLRVVRWRSMAAYYAGMAVRMGIIALAVTVAMLFYKEYFSPVGLVLGLSVGVINFFLLVLGMLVYRVKFKEAV